MYRDRTTSFPAQDASKIIHQLGRQCVSANTDNCERQEKEKEERELTGKTYEFRPRIKIIKKSKSDTRKIIMAPSRKKRAIIEIQH